MPEEKLPFFLREVICPACKKPSEQRFFRMRMYTPVRVESDQHIVEYKWKDPDITPVHPPYFFLYYCPHCSFCDVAEDFNKPHENDYSRVVLREYATIVRKDRRLIDLLTDNLDSNALNFDTAFRIHLLATYLQMLPPKETRDNYKIGRLFLRIAWLFREDTARVRGEARDDSPTVSAVSSTQQEEETHEAVAKDFRQLDQALSELQLRWDRVGISLAEEFRARNVSDTESLKKPQSNIDALLTALKKEVFTLKSAYERTLSHDTAMQRIESAEVVGDTESEVDRELLRASKGIWVDTPADEIEAMQYACRFFENAISADPRFDSPDAYFKAASLVIDLYVRCEDLDAAFGMVRGIYRTGMEARHHITQRLQDVNTEPEMRQRLERQMKRVNVSLQQAADLRRYLLGLLEERELPKIRAILAKNQARKPQEIEKLLEESGIPRGLINSLKEKGGILEHLSTKK